MQLDKMVCQGRKWREERGGSNRLTSSILALKVMDILVLVWRNPFICSPSLKVGNIVTKTYQMKKWVSDTGDWIGHLDTWGQWWSRNKADKLWMHRLARAGWMKGKGGGGCWWVEFDTQPLSDDEVMSGSAPGPSWLMHSSRSTAVGGL